jgi:hypothetical protein
VRRDAPPKAQAFEAALSHFSRRVATWSHASADALKNELVAASRGTAHTCYDSGAIGNVILPI